MVPKRVGWDGITCGAVAAIRREARVEDLSIRELTRRHGVHRRAVRLALATTEPPARKRPALGHSQATARAPAALHGPPDLTERSCGVGESRRRLDRRRPSE